MKNSLESIQLNQLKELSNSHEPLSYSQLCERIGIKKLGGASKKAQLDNLNTVCRYSIQTNPTKYVIEEYYSSFAPSMVDGRSKYAPYIEAILCSMLKINDTLFLTNTDILLMCKMINENFITAKIKKNRLAICDNYDYDILDLDLFVDNTYDNVLKPIVRSALESLERRKAVILGTGYKYKKEISKNFYTVQNASSESQLGKELLSIEHDCLAELNLSGKKVLSPFEQKVYYDYCNVEANKRLGIKSFWRCRVIISNKKIITYELNQICQKLNIAVGSKIFNSKYLDELTGECKRQMIEDMVDISPKVNYKLAIESKQKG